MKVLLVAPRFYDAKFGEKRAVFSAYKTAHELAKHVDVVVVTAGTPPRYEKVSDRLTIYRLWDLYLPDPVNLGIVPGIFTALPSIIRRERPDMFLVNKHMFVTSLAAPLLKLMGKRVIIQTDTFVGINWFSRNPFVSLVMRLYAWTIGLLVLKSADRVVLLHEGLIPVARRLKLPYVVIHNGVDLAKFRKEKPAPDIKKKSGEVFVCFVGRLESAKGYDDLLAAAVSLAPAHPNVKFFFIGNTEGNESIVRKYTSDRIIFTGHRADIAAVLKRMDIFVLPSYTEGLPNALMEAMAAGLAPLSSRVGGAKVLIEERKNGLFFAPGDREELQEKLTRLIQDKALRRRLGIRAKETITHSFNLNKEIMRLLKVLAGSEHGNRHSM